MDYVLWLVSWYPNELNPFNGDFIQRQARAVALYQKIIVVHLQKDTNASIAKNVKEVISTSENVTEIIVFYHPAKTGIKFFDKIFSVKKYKNVYRSTLKKVLETYRNPALVHVHVAMKAGLLAIYLKKKRNIPYIISEHWSGYYAEANLNIYNSGWMQKMLTISILKNASIVITVAESLAKAIKNLAPVEYKIIPNVVDTKLFFYKPVQIKRFRFIHVSSLSKLKTPGEILQAARLLANENISFELILVGNKNDDLLRLAEELKLLNHYVFFMGEIPYGKVAEEMQSSSALVMFSKYESLPCVILEALCCGLPVISSNVGGISEVINNTNGILVESENVIQLKEAMKKMITIYNIYNKEYIAESAGQKFSYSTVGSQISKLYKNYPVK